jgi:hypothetical protein
MKGIKVDCKTGKITEIDDGLPSPEPPPYIEPKGIDLAVLTQKLEEVEKLKSRVEKLERRLGGV